MMEGSSGCSASSTSSPVNAWPSGSHRKLKATDVIEVLSDLFVLRGVPEHIRSDNGPEFVAKAVREWIAAVGAKTAYIEPGSPWENGFIESFNAKLRDELLDGEIFYTLSEAKIVIESWRRHYNPASEHPSVYAIEVNRCLLILVRSCGVLGFRWARSAIDLAARSISSARRRSKGRRVSGWKPRSRHFGSEPQRFGRNPQKMRSLCRD